MLDAEKRRDVQQYVNFPFQLYQDCPQWVPPLVSAAQNVLNRRKHPYYQHSTADFLSGHFQRGHQVPERLWRVAEKVKARGGFWIKTFRSKREMREWIPRVGKIYREAFVEAHTYYR